MRVNPYRLVRCYPTNYIVTEVIRRKRKQDTALDVLSGAVFFILSLQDLQGLEKKSGGITMKQRMLAWLCAGILGLGCWGLPAAAADDTTEPTTQVTTEAETETESSKFSTKDLVTAVIVFTLVTAGTATGVFVFRWKKLKSSSQK